MSQRHPKAGMRWCLALGATAVLVILATVPSALANPYGGRWTGTSKGTRIDLMIGTSSDHHYSQAIRDIAVVCRRASYIDGDNTLAMNVAQIGQRGAVVSFDSRLGLSGRLGDRHGRITVPAGNTVGFDDHHRLRRCSRSSLHNVRIHHVRAAVERDGQYKASGPLGTGGTMFVYGAGALMQLDGVGLGTPIGIPDPEQPEENCAVLQEDVHAVNDRAIYTSGSRRSRFFSSALDDEDGTEADFFSLHGRFVDDHEAVGTYIAHGASLTPPTAPCSGTGRVTMRWVAPVGETFPSPPTG